MVTFKDCLEIITITFKGNKMNKFKVGDKVRVEDSSYSKVVGTYGLEDGYDGFRVRNQQGVIIEMNCKFPNPDKFQNIYGVFNNTIVRLLTNEIVLTEERFLAPTTHTIVIDGKTVELSHESYKNLKEQLV